MKNNTRRLQPILVTAMAIIGLLLTMSGGAMAMPSTEFLLSGQVNNPGTFTLEDLQAFPPTTQSVTYQSGQNTVSASFTGVPLYTLLTDPNGGGGISTNPSIRNDILRHYVLATGSDGYQAAVSVGEIHPNFGGQPDLVAYRVDGQPLGENGFSRLVVPGDRFGGRYVSNLVGIEVLRSASQQTGIGGGISSEFRLSGDVVNSRTYGLADLQALTPQTQAVTYLAGQNRVTGTFTGVSIWDLLTQAGVITDPAVRNDILSKYLVATGSDGYQTVFALGEIHPNFGNRPYLVAYDFNGQGLGEDGFARLAIPGDTFGGRYVFNLVSLEVFDGGTPIPEPGTMVLLATGLAGVLLLRYRRVPGERPEAVPF